MIRLEIKVEPAHVEHFSLEVVFLRSDCFEVTFKDYLANETEKKTFNRFDDVTDYVDEHYHYFDEDIDQFKAMLATFNPSFFFW